MSADPSKDHSTATPEELRKQVERTREQLGHTVQELAAKADVPSRAKARAATITAKVEDAAAGVKDRAQQAATEAAHLAHHAVSEPARDKAAASGITDSTTTPAAKVRAGSPRTAVAAAVVAAVGAVAALIALGSRRKGRR